MWNVCVVLTGALYILYSVHTNENKHYLPWTAHYSTVLLASYSIFHHKPHLFPLWTSSPYADLVTQPSNPHIQKLKGIQYIPSVSLGFSRTHNTAVWGMKYRIHTDTYKGPFAPPNTEGLRPSGRKMALPCHISDYSCVEIQSCTLGKAHWNGSGKDPSPAGWTTAWDPLWNQM